MPDATSIAASDVTELDLQKEIKYGNRIQVSNFTFSDNNIYNTHIYI